MVQDIERAHWDIAKIREVFATKLFLEEDVATSPTLTSFQRVYVGANVE